MASIESNFMKIKFSQLFSVAICGLLFGCAANIISAQSGKVAKPAQTTVQPNDKPNDKPTDKSAKPQETPAQPPAIQASKSGKELKIEFPDIEGWIADETTYYPQKELGYSVNYNSKSGGRVTIYVYNKGLKTISDDLNDEVLKSEIENAKNDILKFVELGYYQAAKEEKADKVLLGGASGKINALRRLFSVSVNERDLISEIYLFGFQNNFIKIRATRPKVAGETTNQAFVDLLAEVDRLFADLKALSAK